MDNIRFPETTAFDFVGEILENPFKFGPDVGHAEDVEDWCRAATGQDEHGNSVGDGEEGEEEDEACRSLKKPNG